MRFMVIIRANEQSEAGVMPSSELMEAMGRYNEEMAAAGVLLACDGLLPSSKGARVHFQRGSKPRVTDGPFTETKELIAGFWIIQTKSKQEAIEWVKRCPGTDTPEESVIEIRQVGEIEDFPADLLTPEGLAREERLREEIANQAAKR